MLTYLCVCECVCGRVLAERVCCFRATAFHSHLSVSDARRYRADRKRLNRTETGYRRSEVCSFAEKV